MFESYRTIKHERRWKKMEKKCNVGITHLENGYRLEITGDEVKNKFKAFFESCFTPERIKECFHGCCDSK